MIYKCSDLINKKRVLNELDFIMQDNQISNPIYSPAILGYSHDLNFKDTSLLVEVVLNNTYTSFNTECEKLEDFLTGVGSLEYNQIYCSVINHKNIIIEQTAKKKNDWSWYSKNEDVLEDILDNISTTYSHVLPSIYKKFTKAGITVLNIKNIQLLLQPTIVINTIQNFYR